MRDEFRPSSLLFGVLAVAVFVLLAAAAGAGVVAAHLLLRLQRPDLRLHRQLGYLHRLPCLPRLQRPDRNTFIGHRAAIGEVGGAIFSFLYSKYQHPGLCPLCRQKRLYELHLMESLHQLSNSNRLCQHW